MKRKKQINFRVTEDEESMFRAVAAKHGIAVTDAIRMLVKLDHDHDLVRRYTTWSRQE